MMKNKQIVIAALYAFILWNTFQQTFSANFLGLNLSCWSDKFKCGEKCIPESSVCDGMVDCEDGSDESNCTITSTRKPCSPYEFQCTEGTCISMDWFCDTQFDCPDKSDEPEKCIEKKRCSGSEFMCRNRRCIPAIYVCDGENDCADNSDEQDCDNKKIDINSCTLEKRLYPCKNLMGCVDIKKLCDGISDCRDASDEGTGCNESKQLVKNCSCSHECLPTPNGTVCLCPPGSKLNHNKCEDINECDNYGICDQICLNLENGYKCSCESDYYLMPDQHTCKSVGPEGLLIYTTLQEIKGLYTDLRYNFTVASNTRHVTGVSSDGRFIYWSSITTGSAGIFRSSLNGDEQKLIVSSGVEAPEDLDVDLITSNIYFTDAKLKQIIVCRSDGRICTVLHDENVDKPRSISLASEHGTMYWTDWGSQPLIGKSNMDGSNFVKLVTDNIAWPNGISADIPAKRLFWVDGKTQTVESIKFDGTDRRLILGEAIEHPFSIAVFDNTLYWSDWEGREILSCNKFTGKNHQSVTKEIEKKIYGIHIYHPKLNRNKLANPCANTDCSDICLTRPSVNGTLSYTCSCADNKYLLADGKTCRRTNTSEILIAAYRNIFYLISLDHIGQHKINEFAVQGIETVSALAYDSISDRLLISDSVQQNIFTYDLNTESPVSPLTGHQLGKIYSMDFDHLGNNLYWCNMIEYSVEALSLSTKKQMTVLLGSYKYAPLALALIPEKGIIFLAVAYRVSQVRLDIIPMSGLLIHRRQTEINFRGLGVAMHYCRSLQRVFWIEFESGTINSVDTEGTDHRTHAHADAPVSIASFQNAIFWAKKDVPHVYHEYENKEQFVKLDLINFNQVDDIKLISVKKSKENSDFSCRKNNGYCYGLCIPSIYPNKQECACPNGLSVTSNGLNCTVPGICADHEYRCLTGECIKGVNLCNKQYECPRGDDELPDRCNWAACPSGQFLCHNKEKCIDKSLVCNGAIDCADRSDEICYIKCNEDQFLCSSGTCIDGQFRCDGKVDCVDGDDELNCTSTTCRSDQFRCDSGKCIPKMFECDSMVDCPDGSDEYTNCTSNVCSSSEFECNNKRCVDILLTCNGRDDCGDNSDEGGGCDQGNSVSQFTFYFRPINGSEKHKQCNSLTQFHCNVNHTHCLPISSRCNGVVECPNGDDEKNCLFDTCPHLDEFQCPISKECIPREWLCDRSEDCRDKSDEDPIRCNKKSIIGVHCDGFRCLSGECIEMPKVCDGKADCSDNSDEGKMCGEDCKRFGCAHHCHHLPTGPQCFCKEGYQLHVDNKTCVDINECNSELCSQYCTNTNGSFTCSCHSPNYVLRSDRLTCKANGHPLIYIIVSDYSIYKISNDLRHVNLLYNAPNKPKIDSLDVDVIRDYVYWSSSTGVIARFPLNEISAMQFVSEIGKTSKITLDWVTGNVYYIESETRIGICNFDSKSCAKLYESKEGWWIKAIAVDAVKGRIFWSEVKFTGFLMPVSIVKTADSNVKNVKKLTQKIPTLIDDLAIDPFKEHLYFLNRNNNSLERVSYHGEETYTMFQVESGTATFIHFENSLYWSTDDNSNYPLKKCKVHGPPPRKCELIQIHPPPISYFTVYQKNKYPTVENTCAKANCTNICVINGTDRMPICLCSNGDVIDSGQQCPSSSTKKFGGNFSNSQNASGSSKVTFAYVIIIILILGLVVGIYQCYKPPKHVVFQKLRFYNPVHRNSANDDQSNGTNPILLETGKRCYENPLIGTTSVKTFQIEPSSKTDNVAKLESPMEPELDYTMQFPETFQTPLIGIKRL